MDRGAEMRTLTPKMLGGFTETVETETYADRLARCHALEPVLRVSDEWRAQTFPPEEIAKSTLVRISEEFQEFLENPVGEEIADVVILLHSWANQNNIDLLAAVKAKVLRNVSATWVMGDDGISRRVKS
jgi:hypothetical protein